LISSIVGLIGALVGVGLTIRQNARINRANLFSSYRLKWMDLFRDELGQVLTLGERVYDPKLQGGSDPRLMTDLHASSKRLIILLGREPGLRGDFAKLVRRFVSSPTAALSDLLESEAQKVFRDAWRRGRADSGEPSEHPIAWAEALEDDVGAFGTTAGFQGNAAPGSTPVTKGSRPDE
jgi:hypothetical protein